VKNKNNIHGFKVPDSYFENFEAGLFQKINEVYLPKDAGFKVPETYFSELEASILNKVTISEKEPKVIPLFKKPAFVYVTTIAACALLFFSVIKTKSNTDLNFENLDFSSIDSYIEDGNIELHADEIMAMLGDDEIIAIDQEHNVFSEQNIKAYLLENLDNDTLLLE
jgi:hypothetical protein